MISEKDKMRKISKLFVNKQFTSDFEIKLEEIYREYYK